MLAGQLAELEEDEGLLLVVYDDATGLPIRAGTLVVGHPTIGAGRALDTHGISRPEAQLLLQNDVAAAETALREDFSWYAWLDPVRQGVLVNLVVNMGLGGLAQFRRMLADLARGDFAAAAAELKNSRWYGEVQASRSDRLVAQLRTGQGPPSPATTPAPDPTIADVMATLSLVLQELRKMSGTQSSLDQAIQQLQQQVTNDTNATNAAVTLVNGIPAMIQQAVQQAQSAGATPQQLQAITAAVAAIQQNAQALGQAVTANTPAAGGGTAGGQNSPAGGTAPAPSGAPSA